MPPWSSGASMDKVGVIYETCYGVIPLRKHVGEWQVLLVQLRAGHWSFPKGHPEPHEEPRHCAIRELTEETGLRVLNFLSQISLTEHYEFRRDGDFVSKAVTYYLAEVAGDLAMQTTEIQEIQWFSLEAAQANLTFPEARKILLEASQLLHLE